MQLYNYRCTVMLHNKVAADRNAYTAVLLNAAAVMLPWLHGKIRKASIKVWLLYQTILISSFIAPTQSNDECILQLLLQLLLLLSNSPPVLMLSNFHPPAQRGVLTLYIGEQFFLQSWISKNSCWDLTFLSAFTHNTNYYLSLFLTKKKQLLLCVKVEGEGELNCLMVVL